MRSKCLRVDCFIGSMVMGILALLCNPFIISSVLGAASPELEVGIYQPTDTTVQSLIDLFQSGGYQVHTLSENELAQLPTSKLSALIIPPATRFPARYRQSLSSYLAQNGNLVDLSASAFNYIPQCLNAIPIVEFNSEQKGYTVARGSVKPEVTYIDAPEGGQHKAIHISTSYIGAGDIFVDIPMSSFKDKNRSVLLFQAMGDYDIEILYLRIIDTTGSDWVAFTQLDRKWQTYKVSLADFVPVDKKAQAAGTVLNPMDISRLHVGFDASVLWSEWGGSFALGPIYLGTPAETDTYAPTSEVLKWRVGYEKNKTQTPAGIIDPFLDTQLVSGALQLAPGPYQTVNNTPLPVPNGALWTIPNLPAGRGKDELDITEIIPKEDMRRIPLLVAKSADGRALGTVAEIRIQNTGAKQSGNMVLFGLDGAHFAANNSYGTLLLQAVDYMLLTPKISRVTINFASSLLNHLETRVLVSNPHQYEVPAQLSVSAGNGLMSGSKQVVVPPATKMEFSVDLGEVPSTFPLTQFTWTAQLQTDRTVDTMGDSINVEDTLIKEAKYMLNLQNGHADGRFGFYFFADIYAARTLLALSRYLENPDVVQRNRAVLGDLRPQDFQTAAFRFTDMIAQRQKNDGSVPMGYSEHKGYSYIADIGTVALGMMQIASWLEGEQRQRYLNMVDKYLDLKQTFYIDAELSAKLETIYGKGHAGTKVGSYGLGFLAQDYFTNKKWATTQRHEAGPWWVLPISMGVAPGMTRLSDNPKYADIAMLDTTNYLKAGYKPERYFHSESAFWLYYTLTDAQLRVSLLKLLEQTSLPAIYTTKPRNWFENGARSALSWLAPTYYRNFIGDSPLLRVAFLKAIWEICSENSTYSVAYTMAKFPHSTYGPSADAERYAVMSGIWFMEMLSPGSTLLKGLPVQPVAGN